MSNVYYSTLLNTHCFKAACVMKFAFEIICISFFNVFFLRKVHLLKKRCGYVMVQNDLYMLCLQAIQVSYIFNIIISVVCNNRGCFYNLCFKKYLYNN